MNQSTGGAPLTHSRLFPRLRKAVIMSVANGRGASTRGRARRSLAWGAIAFVLVTAIFSAAVETVLPQVRDPEYGSRLVRLRAQQRAHPNRPLVLALGTSRTQNAIDAVAMEFPDEPGAPLVFNFGQSGIRPLHLRLILWRLHDAGVRPDAVFVEVFPGFLEVPASADSHFRDSSAQLTDGDVRWLTPYLDDPAALRRRWAVARLDPWSTYRGAHVARFAPEALPWSLRVGHLSYMTDQCGFSGYPSGKATDELRERKRAKMHRTYGNPLGALRVSAATEEAYRGLVADCRERGVRVAFFFTPESPVFQSWYSPESRAALTAFTRMLSEELGCPVFGAPTNYAEDDFADGHHILRPAASRFSRELADRHLRPWFAEVLK